VDGWPLLPADVRRRPVIQAVTARRTTPARIRPLFTHEPEAVRREILAILAARRAFARSLSI
jgi:hypothetical protein